MSDQIVPSASVSVIDGKLKASAHNVVNAH